MGTNSAPLVTNVVRQERAPKRGLRCQLEQACIELRIRDRPRRSKRNWYHARAQVRVQSPHAKLCEQMSSLVGPSHLAVLRKVHADHLVDRGLGHSNRGTRTNRADSTTALSSSPREETRTRHGSRPALPPAVLPCRPKSATWPRRAVGPLGASKSWCCRTNRSISRNFIAM